MRRSVQEYAKNVLPPPRSPSLPFPVSGGCGDSFRENCTYFESVGSTVVSGACSFRVCKFQPGVCQVRARPTEADPTWWDTLPTHGTWSRTFL